MTAAAGEGNGQFDAGGCPTGTAGRAGAFDPLAWQGWMADAACRGVGFDELFGAGAGGRRWCRRPPVVEVCFWWAVLAECNAGYHFGIWGGASPGVRKQVGQVAGIGWARARLLDALEDWAQQSAPPAAMRAG